MDEVGLSTRHGGTPVNDDRANSKTRHPSAHLSQLDTNQNNYSRNQYATPQPQFDHTMQRNVSMDSNAYPDTYGNGLITPQYTHSPAISNAGISPMNPQQLQYQQALLAQAQAQQQRQPPQNYYGGSPGGMHNMTPVSAMQNGMGYATASPAAQQMVDPYRQAMNGSPMLPPGIGFQQQGYGAPMMNMNGYPGYGMQPYFQQGGMQQQQGQMAGQQRRGRVSFSN